MLSLVTYPHKALTTVCDPVPDEWFKGEASTKFLNQIVEMANICNRNHGFALAANQAGLLYRFIVIMPHPLLKGCCVGSDGKPISTPSVMVNPVVLPSGGEVESHKEGCLSFPGLQLPVSRRAVIEAAWMDNVGKAYSCTIKGIFSRVVQHEIDHLNGIQYIDHLSSFDRQKFQDRINKLRRR